MEKMTIVSNTKTSISSIPATRTGDSTVPATRVDLDPLEDIHHRAAATTSVLSDILANVEGVQRWGLNE